MTQGAKGRLQLLWAELLPLSGHTQLGPLLCGGMRRAHVEHSGGHVGTGQSKEVPARTWKMLTICEFFIGKTRKE